MRVHISDHAYYDRYLMYVGNIKRTKLSALVERHLFEALRQGITIENEAIQLEIYHNLNAVVVPGEGRWDVVTFYQTEKQKEVVG